MSAVLGVEVLTPSLDHDHRLGQALEDISVQERIPELRVEAFAMAVRQW